MFLDCFYFDVPDVKVRVLEVRALGCVTFNANKYFTVCAFDFHAVCPHVVNVKDVIDVLVRQVLFCCWCLLVSWVSQCHEMVSVVPVGRMETSAAPFPGVGGCLRFFDSKGGHFSQPMTTVTI